MKKKIALITGAAGQDGVYLSRLLIQKNYKVVATSRSISKSSLWRYKKLKIINNKNIVFRKLDITNENSINILIKKYKFNEIYNLAAQSSPQDSFISPVKTFNVIANGSLKILEAVRKYSPKSKIFQASSASIFGEPLTKIQTEKSSLSSTNVYGASKIFSFNITKIYRDVHKLFACSGILFSHESPLRGENFVTKKIIKNLVLIKKNKIKNISLGNIYSKRDFGYVEDYVKAMWMMLQRSKPDDFIISTNKSYSIKKFIELACEEINIDLKWIGSSMNLQGIDKTSKKVIIRLNKRLLRPLDVTYLRGSNSKAKKILKWKPTYSVRSIIKIMAQYEQNNI